MGGWTEASYRLLQGEKETHRNTQNAAWHTVSAQKGVASYTWEGSGPRPPLPSPAALQLKGCVWSWRNHSGHRDFLSGHSCNGRCHGENQGHTHRAGSRVYILCQTSCKDRHSYPTNQQLHSEVHNNSHTNTRAWRTYSEQRQLKTT